MKKIFLFLLLIFHFSGAVAQTKPVADQLEPEEFQKEILREGVHLIDVCTAEEFKDGHLQAAMNIYFRTEDS